MNIKQHFNVTYFLVTVIVLLAITLPYLFAESLVNNGNSFAGFLLNPIDGNSYLAKMQEGYSGNWLFWLPYSPTNHPPVFLFELYLLLGHISRWLGLSCLLVFHISRIAASLFLITSLWSFLQLFNNTVSKLKGWTFVLCVFGTGMGWLSLAWGSPTMDLWVPEGYPFLSMFVNPHFPLGMGLMLQILKNIYQSEKKIPYFLCAIEALLLAIVLPFGLIIIFSIVLVDTIIKWVLYKNGGFRSLVLIFPAGFFMLGYQLLAIFTNPDLISWNAQNITPAPAFWDFLLAFSPLLLFAGYGIYKRILKKEIQQLQIPLIWVIVAILMIFAPIALQRRFITGLLIPIAILAVDGMNNFSHKKFNWALVIILITLPTNILAIASGVFGVKEQNPLLVISEGEFDALHWLNQNCLSGDIVLASPQMGLFIPAHSNCTVLYGHPFETVNAIEMETHVDNFFRYGILDSNITRNRISYLFIGDREREIGNVALELNTSPIFNSNEVTIYQVETSNP